jgi:squalene-hopene/tetraprenyl-beta-curcumene cyclase
MIRWATLLFCATTLAAEWDPRTAAQYLDARQKEWFAWPVARAAGGACLSCHTNMTYLLARPVLRRVLGESQPTEWEKGQLDALRTRAAIQTAKEFAPKAAQEKAAQGFGVETVLAALLLPTPDTIPALDRMWTMQRRDGSAKGAWPWFELDLDPWETSASPYYGASLAAIAVAAAPADYRKRPPVKERIADLTAYLQGGQAAQPLHNRLALVWAATKLHGLLPEAARRAIVEEALEKQQADGGWTTESIGPWTTHEKAPPDTGSNAYATAWTTFVLRQVGVSRRDPRLGRAIRWLESHQDRTTGAWPAMSMNKQYPENSMQIRFMQDAATAFAVMALADR